MFVSVKEMDYWAYARADISRLLSRAGITLVLIAAIRFTSEVLPLGLLYPGWYLGLARELINISPVLLTGLTMQMIARRIVDPTEETTFNPMPWIAEQRLLRGMALIYALLIPLQLGAAFLFDRDITNSQRFQLQSIQRQLAATRAAGSAFGKPNPQINRLQAMEVRLTMQQRQTTRRRFALLVDSLRICASAAVLAWVLSGAVRMSDW